MSVLEGKEELMEMHENPGYEGKSSLNILFKNI